MSSWPEGEADAARLYAVRADVGPPARAASGFDVWLVLGGTNAVHSLARQHSAGVAAGAHEYVECLYGDPAVRVRDNVAQREPVPELLQLSAAGRPVPLDLAGPAEHLAAPPADPDSAYAPCASASSLFAYAAWQHGGVAPGRKLMLVPCGAAGSGFGAFAGGSWAPDARGDAGWLAPAIARAQAAMRYREGLGAGDGDPDGGFAATNAFRGVIWHAGEEDAALPADEYRAQLRRLIARVRAALPGPSAFLAAGPPPAFAADRPDAPLLGVLAEPLAERYAYVPADGCHSYADRVERGGAVAHTFSAEGAWRLAGRLWAAYATLTAASLPTVSRARAWRDRAAPTWRKSDAPVDGAVIDLEWRPSDDAFCTEVACDRLPARQVVGARLRLTGVDANAYTFTLRAVSRGGVFGEPVVVRVE